MYVHLFVFVVTLAFFVTAKDQKYCNVATCNGLENSGCLYSSKETSPSCGKVKRFGLTAAEKQEILDAHNRLRDLVASGKEVRGNPGPQPGATNLKHLEWSDELADIAQSWTNRCIFGHDPCSDTPEEQIGQNTAIRGWYDDPDSLEKPWNVTELVEYWYDEVNDFDGGAVKALHFREGEKTGHYTQIVAAKTTRVGCGIIDYQKNPPITMRFIVCNYGPSGNTIGYPLYS